LIWPPIATRLNPLFHSGSSQHAQRSTPPVPIVTACAYHSR
jgi:hypothetical protein